MAEDNYRVELTASFLERLDAIEVFLSEADAAFVFDKLIAEQASLVALRQSIAASLPGMRADRTAAIAERATMFASVQADRPGVLSALAALRAQRDAILGA